VLPDGWCALQAGMTGEAVFLLDACELSDAMLDIVHALIKTGRPPAPSRPARRSLFPA